MTQDNLEGNSPSEPKRSRFVFSLSTLFGVVLWIAVMLSLVTQLGRIGFVLFCFITGSVLGFWYRRYRLSTASSAALAVFVISYLACWVQLDFSPVTHHPFREPMHQDLRHIGEALSIYVERNGVLPDSLPELAELEDPDLNFNESGQLSDRWHNPYYYRKDKDKYEVASLGADRKFGGIGWDADIYLVDKENSGREHLSFWQFSFASAGSHIVFLSALFASLAAVGICYAEPIGRHSPTTWSLAGAIVTTIFAIFVAVYLAAFHIASSQSGH